MRAGIIGANDVVEPRYGDFTSSYSSSSKS